MNLEQGKDIYMYRGEMTFCNAECRNQRILLEEGVPEFEAKVGITTQKIESN